jgi:hypothetical protein
MERCRRPQAKGAESDAHAERHLLRHAPERASVTSAYAKVDSKLNCKDRVTPYPNGTRIMRTNVVEGVSRPQAKMRSAAAAQFTEATARKPKRRKMRVVKTFMLRLPTALASNSRPEWKADKPPILCQAAATQKFATEPELPARNARWCPQPGCACCHLTPLASRSGLSLQYTGDVGRAVWVWS